MSLTSEPGTPTPAPETPSALAPLRRPVFRMLWATWLIANSCMWMNDVAAAWLMTSLTTSPAWVAAVQTASTLPVFLLGLPSGALADILDRRRYFMATQFWVAAVALLLCVVLMFDGMSAPVLLFLVFLNGVGLALRWPVFSAIVPELVPRKELPAALALNGVSMNASRIIGPLLAGAIIAAAGSLWVFALNAVMSIIAGITVWRWKREATPPNPLGREPLLSAMRVGLQYVGQSARLRGVLLRIAIFFLHSTALLALLPLVARAMPGGNAGTFTLLLAAMGAGAITAALSMQVLRRHMSSEALAFRGAALQAVGSAVMAFSPPIYIGVPVMFLAGAAWITTANTLTVSAQMALPDWVRARGMSMYQMSIMGASASGAALWGQVATYTSIQTSLLVAAFTGASLMYVAQRLMPVTDAAMDLTPARPPITHPLPEAVDAGRVVVTIEYLIDPDRANEFRAVMEESRRVRIGQGALAWFLLHDTSNPARFIEQVVDVSWTEHLRRFDRVTAADLSLRERRLAFHVGDTPPLITRYVVDNHD
jgi:MFS family permease